METTFYSIFPDSSQLLPLEVVFSSAGTYFLANLSFRLVKTSSLPTGNSIFLFQVFFCKWEILLKFGGIHFLKTNHTAASGHHFFPIFFRYFLKWKPCFRILKAYSSISFTRLVQTNFLPTETVLFWSELFCCY